MSSKYRQLNDTFECCDSGAAGYFLGFNFYHNTAAAISQCPNITTLKLYSKIMSRDFLYREITGWITPIFVSHHQG
jgi:hypothetical protein